LREIEVLKYILNMLIFVTLFTNNGSRLKVIVIRIKKTTFWVYKADIHGTTYTTWLLLRKVKRKQSP